MIIVASMFHEANCLVVVVADGGLASHIEMCFYSTTVWKNYRILWILMIGFFHCPNSIKHDLIFSNNSLLWEMGLHYYHKNSEYPVLC